MKEEDEIKYYLSNILKELKSQNKIKKQWYDVERTITTSQPVEPVNNLNAYQFEDIRSFYDNLANGEDVTIENESGGLLYVIYRHSGSDTDYSPETSIDAGHEKHFYDVAKIGLRSPTAGLRYRVTEHQTSAPTGSRITDPFVKTRDNSGKIVFQDDYESPTLKFNNSIVGLGTIARSTDTAYFGDFSLKMVTGAVAGDQTSTQYMHTDFHTARIASQIQFASASDPYDIDIALVFDDGTNEYTGDAFVTTSFVGNTSDFYLIDENSTNILLANDVYVTSDIKAWNSMKLVIDLAEQTYVRAIINGQVIDRDMTGTLLTDYNLAVTPVVTTRHIESYFGVSGSAGGSVATAYFDNYILTEDEV